MRSFVSPIRCEFLMVIFIPVSNEISDLNNTGKVKDIVGNEYPVVTSGNQVWITGNLSLINAHDGSAITAYVQHDDEPKPEVYGKLHTWAITKKSCPAGWHIVLVDEWDQPIGFLVGSSIAGGKSRESGTEQKCETHPGATNETGFNALPVGYRKKSVKCGNFQITFPISVLPLHRKLAQIQQRTVITYYKPIILCTLILSQRHGNVGDIYKGLTMNSVFSIFKSHLK